MSVGRLVAIVGILLGLVGLGIDFQIIMGAAPANIYGDPVERSTLGQLVYFWVFFTHLTNLGLILFYVADLTRWRGLSALRQPVWRASMAGMIALVMVFFHVMLAPNYTFTGGLLIANYILHYATPLLFLLWWAAFIPHGGLRYADIPLMLAPGAAYVAIVLIRGAVTGDYPYAILDVTRAGYVGVAAGVAIIFAAVGVFCALLVFLDSLLGRRTVAVSS